MTKAVFAVLAVLAASVASATPIVCSGEVVLGPGVYEVDPIVAGCTLRGESHDAILNGGLQIDTTEPVVISNVDIQGTLWIKGAGHLIEHVKVTAPATTGIWLDGAERVTVRDSYVSAGHTVVSENPVNKDSGKNIIADSVLLPSKTGVMWHSGGPLRVVNCHIKGGEVGVQIEPLPTGLAEAKEDVLISGNTMREQSSRNVRIIRGETVSMSQVVITGNRFFSAPIGIAAGDLTGLADPWWLQGIVISGNSFREQTSGVVINHAAGVTVEGNVYMSVGTKVSVGAACVNVDVGD